MARRKEKSRSSAIAAVLSAGILAGGLAWMFWPSRIELSPDAYHVAVALYRVCNQQDELRLQQIENELDQLETPKDKGVIQLREIIKVASNGQWQVAMRDTRNILEDQTTKK